MVTISTRNSTKGTQGSGLLKPLSPGSTLGILGGGQLGRMFAEAAKSLGYRVHVFCPEPDPPAGEVSDAVTCGSYDDAKALTSFATAVDVVTLEFENVSVAATQALSALVPVRPNGPVLYTTQNRLREKRFVENHGAPVTPFREALSALQVAAAVEELGGPCVVKTVELGYDGKGQRMIDRAEDAERIWRELFPRGTDQPCIVERRVNLESEASCIIARALGGESVIVGTFGNSHVDHILDTTIFPAKVPSALEARMHELSRKIADALEYVGVLCVEFFIDVDGNVLVNELAPRPHNSGHVTIEAVECSQFAQQARAVAGMSLGSPRMVSPGAMVNLLGDLWADGEPSWKALERFPDAHLHLYGKREAKPKRKMGHLTVLNADANEAARYAQAARAALLTR